MASYWWLKYQLSLIQINSFWVTNGKLGQLPGIGRYATYRAFCCHPWITGICTRDRPRVVDGCSFIIHRAWQVRSWPHGLVVIGLLKPWVFNSGNIGSWHTLQPQKCSCGGPGFCFEHRLKAAVTTQLCPSALSPTLSHQPTGQSLLDRRYITVVKMQNVASCFLLLLWPQGGLTYIMFHGDMWQV